MKLVLLTLLLLAAAEFNFASTLTEEEKNILEFEPSEEVRKTFYHYLSGYDDQGAPIWIWPFGRWDFRKLVEKGEQKNVEMYVKKIILRWRESARNNTVEGDEKPGLISIMDLQAYPLAQVTHAPTLRLVLDLIGFYSRTITPAEIKLGYIVNANYIFERFWVFAKVILTDLLGTIEIYGNNPNTWKAEFRKRGIPRDQLPEYYGGTKDHKFVASYD
ncbi:unnamed protein product [Allacma fusca]|uniref:CRAL-TRIO domain-containing protein n=1 Tax=Allacma fusca TaxID=39272 RepID=A0A8J2KXC5_9HEXA|nr:unnamed protein product [Allacma fusca]